MKRTDRDSRDDAAKCRARGWRKGTRLVGTNEYGTKTIRITAVGETSILAVQEPDGDEVSWTLSLRNWKRADRRKR